MFLCSFSHTVIVSVFSTFKFRQAMLFSPRLNPSKFVTGGPGAGCEWHPYLLLSTGCDNERVWLPVDPSSRGEVYKIHVFSSCAVREYSRPRKFLNGQPVTQPNSALGYTYKFFGIECAFMPGITTRPRDRERATWRQGTTYEPHHGSLHCRCCLSERSELLRWFCFIMIPGDDSL